MLEGFFSPPGGEFEIVTSPSLRVLMIAGLAIREVFSFWTGNPFDFELWVRTGYWVAHGVSPYGVLQPAPGLSFASVYSLQSESTIGYLSFWPLLLGGIYKLYALVGFGDRFVYYFLIKQPIIIGDVLLAYAIFRYVRAFESRSARTVLILWLFSPYTILVSGVWGMFDSLAMLFVLVAMLAGQGLRRSGAEGLAVWVKSIPLIYAIPLAFSGRQRVRNLAVSIAIPAGGTLLSILVFRWPISTALATLNSTALKGGQSMSAMGIFFYAQTLGLVRGWPVPLLEGVGLIWIPALIVSTILAYRWFGFETQKGLVQSLLLCTLTFMIFKAQVNEQYAVYLLALLLVDVGVWHPSRRWLYFAITAVVMAYLLVNNAALIRFLGPIYPQSVQLDQALDRALGPIRFTLLLLCSIAFSTLNVVYFRLLTMSRRTRQALAPSKQTG